MESAGSCSSLVALKRPQHPRLAAGPGLRLEIRGELNIDGKKIKGVPRLLAGSVSKAVEEMLVKKITPNLISVSDGLRRYLEKHAS